MGLATQIPESTFAELQLDAGVLLDTYDISKPFDIKRANIVTATTGGIQATCQPSYSDLGEDVDNCPSNTKELKHLDYWTSSLGGTGLGARAKFIQKLLGAADIDEATGKITPRNSLKQTDFSDMWWVGDLSDGGLAVVRLINALSTDGLSLQTTKNGKGQFSFTFTGHYSIENQEQVPMEFYIIAPANSQAKKA